MPRPRIPMKIEDAVTDLARQHGVMVTSLKSFQRSRHCGLVVTFRVNELTNECYQVEAEVADIIGCDRDRDVLEDALYDAVALRLSQWQKVRQKG